MTFLNNHKILIATAVFSLACQSQAETLWSSNSLSYLKNTSDFELLENDNTNVLTFEHVSGHNWGDVFFFTDRITASQDAENPSHKETYSEFSPRLSLAYLTDKPVGTGLIKDVLISTTYEHSTVAVAGSGFGFNNYLVGVAANWNIEGFSYVSSNVYRAYNGNTDDDYQLTVTWGYPFTIKNQKFTFDGFFDWSSAADDHSADFHLNPQLRWDLGNNFGIANKVEIGVEYSYWHNKFGISALDNESVISAMVKVTL